MFKCKFYYGDYKYRQKFANEDDAVLYIEHHFNSSYTPKADYSLALVGSNASETSIKIGNYYANRVAEEFGISSRGCVKTKFGRRGDYNLRYTKMPAVLLEPLFVSNMTHVNFILEDNGIERLSECLVDTITKFFKEGLIAFSVGHKYKRTKPHDRGASVKGRPEYTEADLAEWVLWTTKCKLENKK